MNFEHANNFAYGNYFFRSDLMSNFAGSLYHETPVRNELTLSDNASTFQNAIDPHTNAAVQVDNQRKFMLTLTIASPEALPNAEAH